MRRREAACRQTSPALKKPPQHLTEAMGTPLPPALQTVRKRVETE
ncbi:hypothetical protein [Dendronalium sp. ChiSLP03b]|nr:hypothetical protein [Dendronalium sp. ChiSLP03b]